MRLIGNPRVAEAAHRTLEARRRLNACPPANPMWRGAAVEAEVAWQALYETVGRNSAAAQLALREAAGVA